MLQEWPPFSQTPRFSLLCLSSSHTIAIDADFLHHDHFHSASFNDDNEPQLCICMTADVTTVLGEAILTKEYVRHWPCFASHPQVEIYTNGKGQAEDIRPQACCSSHLLRPVFCQLLVLAVLEITCKARLIPVLPPALAMRRQARLTYQPFRIPNKICDPIDASRRVSPS